MAKNSIRYWLLGPFIGLFLFPLLLTTAFFTLQNYYLEKKNISIQQQKFTALQSDKISSFLNEQVQIMASMLTTNYLPGLSLAQRKDVLAKFLASVKDADQKAVYNRISLLDDKGKETLRVSRVNLVQDKDLGDLSSTEEFSVPAAKHSIYYSPVFYDNITGEPFMKISMPVQDLSSLALKGILVLELNLRALWNYVGSLHIGKTGTAYITDSNGQLIAHKNRSLIYSGTHREIPAEPTIMQGITGIESIVAAQKIRFGEREMVFMTELPTSEAYKYINMTLLIMGLFFLFICLGGLAVGYIVVHKIIRPVESLANTARNISRGDLTLQADPSRMDELGDLAIAFNTMIAKLVNSIKDLEKEKNFANNVIESLSHPFYVVDVKDYTIKLANSAAGFGSLERGKTCHQLTHNSSTPCSGKEHPCTIKEILKTKKPVTFEHVHRPDDAAPKLIEIYGYPIFDEAGEVIEIIEYNIDVTEKRNLEAQLHQSQKLESIGVLTGGVAHDFNNLLTTILGYSQIIMMKHPEDEKDREYIHAIFEAAEKAASLTRQLLAFSRKQVMEIEVINLNDLVNNILKMLKRLIGEKIEIRTLLKAALGNIKADQGQIEQVLMNLIVNARDAMPAGGTVYVETDAVELDKEYCRAHAEVTPGSYILLSVTDTGTGIPPEIIENIFDPFFTTKKKGEGTGLGLATVYGIIKQLKGHIYVYSEVSCGTTFKIYFPEEQESVAAPLIQQKNVLQPGTETILIVDDEKSILMLSRDTLQPSGYTVFTANFPKDAVEIAQRPGLAIDMLLTDVIMPDMNGRELAGVIESLQPGIKVLFMSGYTDNIIAQEGILEPGFNFIPKPLVPTLLTAKIRSILDKKAA